MPDCFECGKTAHHDHHVVPVVHGGTKTVPLCLTCHALVHSRKSMAASELTRLGLERARARGVFIGRPRQLPQETMERIHALRSQGKSLQAVADALNAQGIPGAHGGSWFKQNVHQAIKRYGAS